MILNLSELEERCTSAIDKAVNVPDPNEDTGKHLALISVADLRALRELVRRAADSIENL